MKLPANRAFLIRLAGDTGSEADPLFGKVEHVQSGRSARFDSLDELRTIVAGLLTHQDSEIEQVFGPRGADENER